MLAGALALLYFPWQGKAAADRDSLNRTLYQTRLDELAQEDNVADREAMVVELQRTLLADIPDVTPAKVRPLSRWVLLPGAAALVLLSSGIFLKTSDIGGVALAAGGTSDSCAAPAGARPNGGAAADGSAGSAQARAAQPVTGSA